MGPLISQLRVFEGEIWERTYTINTQRNWYEIKTNSHFIKFASMNKEETNFSLNVLMVVFEYLY